jgi:hypothetical protein
MATEEQLLFADHYKRVQLDLMFDRLAKLLGVKYSATDLQELVRALANPKKRGNRGKIKTDAPKDLFVPLALLVNPQSIDILKNAAKGMRLKTHSDGDLSSMDKDAYKELMERSLQKTIKDAVSAINASEEKPESVGTGA